MELAAWVGAALPKPRSDPSPYSNNQLNPELLRTTQTKWSYVPGVNPMAVDLNHGCMQIEPMGLQGRFRPGITHHKTAGSTV